MMELGQRWGKGSTNDSFIFDIQFDLNNSADTDIDVGAESISLVTTSTKGFCKYTIENITKYFLVGSCLLLNINTIVPVISLGKFMRYSVQLDIVIQYS